MAKSMTKSQIADHLAGKAGITKKTAVLSRSEERLRRAGYREIGACQSEGAHGPQPADR